MLSNKGRFLLHIALWSQQLRLQSQPNFESIQVFPRKEPVVLEHADDNARGNTLFLGEFPDDMRTAW